MFFEVRWLSSFVFLGMCALAGCAPPAVAPQRTIHVVEEIVPPPAIAASAETPPPLSFVQWETTHRPINAVVEATIKPVGARKGALHFSVVAESPSESEFASTEDYGRARTVSESVARTEYEASYGAPLQPRLYAFLARATPTKALLRSTVTGEFRLERLEIEPGAATEIAEVATLESASYGAEFQAKLAFVDADRWSLCSGAMYPLRTVPLVTEVVASFALLLGTPPAKGACFQASIRLVGRVNHDFAIELLSLGDVGKPPLVASTNSSSTLTSFRGIEQAGKSAVGKSANVTVCDGDFFGLEMRVRHHHLNGGSWTHRGRAEARLNFAKVNDALRLLKEARGHCLQTTFRVDDVTFVTSEYPTVLGTVETFKPLPEVIQSTSAWGSTHTQAVDVLAIALEWPRTKGRTLPYDPTLPFVQLKDPRNVSTTVRVEEIRPDGVMVAQSAGSFPTARRASAQKPLDFTMLNGIDASELSPDALEREQQFYASLNHGHVARLNPIGAWGDRLFVDAPVVDLTIGSSASFFERSGPSAPPPCVRPQKAARRASICWLQMSPQAKIDFAEEIITPTHPSYDGSQREVAVDVRKAGGSYLITRVNPASHPSNSTTSLARVALDGDSAVGKTYTVDAEVVVHTMHDIRLTAPCPQWATCEIKMESPLVFGSDTGESLKLVAELAKGSRASVRIRVKSAKRHMLTAGLLEVLSVDGVPTGGSVLIRALTGSVDSISTVRFADSLWPRLGDAVFIHINDYVHGRVSLSDIRDPETRRKIIDVGWGYVRIKFKSHSLKWQAIGDPKKRFGFWYADAEVVNVAERLVH